MKHILNLVRYKDLLKKKFKSGK